MLQRALMLFLLSTLALPIRASVDAINYHSFWLWSAAHYQPVMSQATSLYLHQGEILSRPAGPRFIKLGRAPTRIQTEQLWLVVRVNVLPLSADHEKLLAQLYRKWRKAGAQVTGIQIDFDAATHQLHRYAASLRQLRQVLPTNCKISVTGLLDWAQTGDIAQLNSLPVDEIVIQTYQGKRTVPGYNAYLSAMMQFRIPFKVGLVQGGDWNESWQKFLSKSQYYKGEVVFLVNQPHGSN